MKINFGKRLVSVLLYVAGFAATIAASLIFVKGSGWLIIALGFLVFMAIMAALESSNHWGVPEFERRMFGSAVVSLLTGLFCAGLVTILENPAVGWLNIPLILLPCLWFVTQRDSA